MTPRWAIVPTAGRGTRLRPATDAVPKVLLPVGLRPMLAWALDEALAAGARELIVVTSPRHRAVHEYLDRVPDAADWPPQARLHRVDQPGPAGLGDALMRCRPLTGDEPFGVVVPDNWFHAAEPPLAQVAATRERTGLDAIGLVEVRARDAPRLGNVGGVELEHRQGTDYGILALADKAPGSFRPPGSEPVLRGCARYVLGPDFYEALQASRGRGNGEWDDVPAFQHRIAAGQLAGCRLEVERFFDVGQPAGYLAAMCDQYERRLNESGATGR